ncbi:MAG: carbohydrate-binding family 9-like protein, partial [Bacteroidota bacterium]
MLWGQDSLPPLYHCLPSGQPLHIDGRLNEPAWKTAAWTTDFVDIEGLKRPLPFLRTRAKMLWDAEYLYIAAELEEPNLWATFDQRDMIIFHENNFEVFIDPTGDTHNYLEIEINAQGTIWDLLLTKPYRDQGKAIDEWNMKGLKSAVHVVGTLNDPADKDEGWTVEIALPWKALEEVADHAGHPRTGEVWRMNFSRVEWRLTTENGTYKKVSDPQSGKVLPEYNWVWAPQGVIAMHQPETWAYVVFEGDHVMRGEQKTYRQDFAVQKRLRDFYKQQKAFFKQYGRFGRLSELEPLD